MQDTRAALEERWSRIGVRDEDLVPESNGTITAYDSKDDTEDMAPPSPNETAARPPSGEAATASATTNEEVVLGPVLGVGGMGVVHVASQPGLRREVAVKRIRPERKLGASVSALLREAWVMGSLEHPNVPPVHLLIREADGTPRVVMKRIEGVAWDALIESPSAAAKLDAEDELTRDPLAFHLRVLINVCHAVHFAHSRGVLHLDLKPDNVMVGRYGEVQVVDWGIAMSFGESGPAWLPASKQLQGVRGTPAWLAPELAAAEPDLISPRTDVYLLGGILHSILTGQPRHDADNLKDALVQAWLSEPYPYEDDVPSELAELANRATAKDPSARPASAEAFRQHIESFLAHRASVRLSEAAARRTDPLLARLSKSADGADASMRRELVECEFAFRQALEIWAENPVAKVGLARLLEAQAAEQERISSLERDADKNLHRRTRAKLALACGITFIVWNGLAGALQRAGILKLTLGDLVWFDTATTIIFGIVAFAVRKTLWQNDFNRRVVILFGGGFIAVFVMWIGAWQLSLVKPELGLTVGDVVALSTMIFVYFVICLTFMMDARIIWLAVPAAVLAALAPRASEYAFELLGFGGFMIGTALAVIWWRPRSDVTRHHAGSRPVT